MKTRATATAGELLAGQRSDAGEQGRPEVEAEVGLERGGGAQEGGLVEDRRGELQPDREPALSPARTAR